MKKEGQAQVSSANFFLGARFQAKKKENLTCKILNGNLCVIAVKCIKIAIVEAVMP